MMLMARRGRRLKRRVGRLRFAARPLALVTGGRAAVTAAKADGTWTLPSGDTALVGGRSS